MMTVIGIEKGDLRNDHARRVLEQMELVELQIDGQHRHAEREQEPDGEEGVDGFAGAEAVARQGIGGHRAKGDGGKRRAGGDHGAVEQEAPEQPLGDHLGIVGHDPGVGEAGGIVVELRVGAKAVQDDEEDRDQGEDHDQRRGHITGDGQQRHRRTAIANGGCRAAHAHASTALVWAPSTSRRSA